MIRFRILRDGLLMLLALPVLLVLCGLPHVEADE